MKVSLPLRREPLLPIPVWDWPGPEGSHAVVVGHQAVKGNWRRPVLPKPVPGRLDTLLVIKGSNGTQGWTPSYPIYQMREEDLSRAEVVLALYLRGHGDDWWSFKDSGPGYAFMGYPGPPVHYATDEVWYLRCCREGGMHRWVAPDRPLRNPVEYQFCADHWQGFLQWSEARGATLELPATYDPYPPRVVA